MKKIVNMKKHLSKCGTREFVWRTMTTFGTQNVQYYREVENILWPEIWRAIQKIGWGNFTHDHLHLVEPFVVQPLQRKLLIKRREKFERENV